MDAYLVAIRTSTFDSPSFLTSTFSIMYSIFTVLVAERIDAIDNEHILHIDVYSQDIVSHLKTDKRSETKKVKKKQNETIICVRLHGTSSSSGTSF